LVKINIEENAELAEMLSISSVPAIFLVYKGNVVDSFVGLPDQKKLDNFFESVTLLRGIGEDEKVIQAVLVGADECMNKKIYDRAENMLNEAYSHKKWREKYSHIIKLGLALCAYNLNNHSLAEKLLKDIKTHHKNQISADPILNKKLALLELKLQLLVNPELVEKKTEDFLQEIEKNPTDLDLRYKLAVHQFENSNYEAAIDTLLELIQIDRNWKDKAANKFLIQIFNFLGSQDKLTITGRNKLTKILY
jgi:putative thioredoxin